MRISDWSSDVCSSDLHFHVGEFFRSEILNRGEHRRKSRGIEPTATIAASCGDVSEDVGCHLIVQSQSPGGRMGLYLTLHARARSASIIARSEEHTSELQSLMRISYAVFCLKKKKTLLLHHTQTHQ